MRTFATFCFSACLLPLAAQTTITGNFMHGGIQREYRLYVPAVYNAATAVPLVLNLHGYTSNNVAQEIYGEFRPIADTANFLLVAPNGTLDGSGNRFWNAFGVGAVDDLGFLVALIDTISAHYSVDQDRVYSTGMSNGGYMSYDLACYRSDRITAIASVTGTMNQLRLNFCEASHPTPVMHIHGTADPTVPYAGGSGSVAVEDLVDHWVMYNGCDPVPAFTALPDISTTDGCTAEHYVYTNGEGGSSVEFYKILGGGHTWPGAIVDIGVTNHDMDASKEIWRFFSQYRLGDLQTGVLANEAVQFSVGPNPSNGPVTLRFPSSAIRLVSITDALGRTVLQHRTSAGSIEVDPQGPGVYLITVQEGDRVGTQRVVTY